MVGTQEGKHLEKICTNILQTRYEDFDQATVKHAKNRIMDTIGCLIGGAGDTGNAALVDMVRDEGGNPEATILIYGGKVPTADAAMVNSLLARSFDFEPVSPLANGISFPGHVSGTTVMTALAAGEAEGISGKELIAALLVGDDVAARVLIAGGFEFNRGWDNIGTVNALGATAIAGRLLGLDEQQLRDAFGIVLNQLAGSMQIVWDATTSFKLCQGLAARNGIFSARLAKAGWSGPTDALFGKFGYFNLYTDGCRNPEILTLDLGHTYYSDGTFKPYPCCRLNHAPIDCALAIAHSHDLNASEISEIIISVSPGVMNHICGQPLILGRFPHANAAFNMRYTVATACLRKSVKLEHFTEKFIRDPDIFTFMDKIKLEERPGADLESVCLRVVKKNGGAFTENTDIPKGDHRNPLSKDELTAKFWDNVLFGKTISDENAASALHMIEGLENMDNVRSLTSLLISR